VRVFLTICSRCFYPLYKDLEGFIVLFCRSLEHQLSEVSPLGVISSEQPYAVVYNEIPNQMVDVIDEAKISSDSDPSELTPVAGPDAFHTAHSKTCHRLDVNRTDHI
jgi:hypothetical protein